jgi:hypothetical protein
MGVRLKTEKRRAIDGVEWRTSEAGLMREALGSAEKDRARTDLTSPNMVDGPMACPGLYINKLVLQ